MTQMTIEVVRVQEVPDVVGQGIQPWYVEFREFLNGQNEIEFDLDQNDTHFSSSTLL